MIKHVKELVFTILRLIALALLIWNFRWLFIRQKPEILPETFQREHKAVQKVYKKPVLATKRVVARDVPEIKKSPIPVKEIKSVVKVKVKEKTGEKKELIFFTDKFGNLWKGVDTKVEFEQIHIIRRPLGFCIKPTAGWEFTHNSPYVGVFLFQVYLLHIGAMTLVNKEWVIGIGAGINYKMLSVGVWKGVAGAGKKDGLMFTVGITI